MVVRNAIGIDPDAKGFVCAYVNVQEGTVGKRRFMVSEKDLVSFVKWVKAEGDVIVALEGSNGQSRPIEKVLRGEGVIFYSFKPADTDKFRKAVLGQNKDNRKDAEAVARYALALEAQQKLQMHRRVWFVDQELQLLTRVYQSISGQMTAEVNRLWKLVRMASPDLYLAVGGKHPEVELKDNVLTSQGILSLLVENPEIGEWKSFSEAQFFCAMGNRNYQGRGKLIQDLRKVAASFPSISPAMALMIRSSAQQVTEQKGRLAEIMKMLEQITQRNAAVQALKQIRGIGTITASRLVAEIVDSRRFLRDDNLASYSGFGLKEHSTGEMSRMVHSEMFNHRLKDAFMTAARNVVCCDPNSHLAGYCRNLVKNGMTTLEAYKRVARALVRVIFKVLSSVTETGSGTPVEEQRQGQSDMASGLIRSDDSHESDIPLMPPHESKARKSAKIKTEPANADRTEKRGRGKTVKKTA